MKKILFVINTLGRAGAENSLLELLKHLDPKQYEVSLYVIMGQGELASELPEHVRLLNKHYRNTPVLGKQGQKGMVKQVLKAMFTRGTLIRRLPYLFKNLFLMLGKKQISVDKLLWRILSDGGEFQEETYDLAVAYIEGGATYYVADHVHAVRKAAFIHVDYQKAGYTKALDKDCYAKFDKMFAVSQEVKIEFEKFYPQWADKTDVFRNILDVEGIRKRALEPGGFTDSFDGVRILTIGRLTAQKGLEVSIEAMALLKRAFFPVRWYVLGEGDQRDFLKKTIEKAGLQEDFILLGSVDNPYPYLAQADLYVHASRFEGKSIAIQEAQVLGKAIVVSDRSGNREQVIDREDGIMCRFHPESIRDAIDLLLHDKELKQRLEKAAALKNEAAEKDLYKLFDLLQ